MGWWQIRWAEAQGRDGRSRREAGPWNGELSGGLQSWVLVFTGETREVFLGQGGRALIFSEWVPCAKSL